MLDRLEKEQGRGLELQCISKGSGSVSYQDQSTIPEWLNQRLVVGRGEATWEDYSFEERTCRGWLLPYLWALDGMFSKRWDYWTRTLEKGEMLAEPIPKIEFEMFPNAEALKNLESCLRKYVHMGVRLNDFLEWLLWGFGEGEDRPRVAPEVNEFWYRTFNLGFLLRNPHDYWGGLLTEQKSGYWNNPNAFYPTPHAVCEAMARMTFVGDGDFRDKTVCDPCVGTGRLLLFASNYSLRIFGADIDRVCVQACRINGYLYVPWMVKPGKIFPEVAEVAEMEAGQGPLMEPMPAVADEGFGLPVPLNGEAEALKVGNVRLSRGKREKADRPRQLLLFE